MPRQPGPGPWYPPGGDDDDEDDDGGSGVAVSGSASWHYDPDEASASGNIEAEFTVSLQDQLIEL